MAKVYETLMEFNEKPMEAKTCQQCNLRQIIQSQY
jgi:hypothetical protein